MTTISPYSSLDRWRRFGGMFSRHRNLIHAFIPVLWLWIVLGVGLGVSAQSVNGGTTGAEFQVEVMRWGLSGALVGFAALAAVYWRATAYTDKALEACPLHSEMLQELTEQIAALRVQLAVVQRDIELLHERRRETRR